MYKNKILYLSDSSIDKPGGAQQSMKVLIEGINHDSDYEIIIISPKGEPLNDRNIVLEKHYNFILRKNRLSDNLKIFFDIYRYIKLINPQIIHLQMTSTMVIVNLLRRLGLISKKIPIIYTDRGVYGKYGLITTLSINSIIKESTKIITTTYNNQRNYMSYFKRFKDYKHKFQVIYNTAGKKYDGYEDDQKKKIRDDLGIKDDELVVGFCGRFSEQKNWPLAKKIINLCSRLTNIKVLMILGSDKTDDDRIRINEFISEIESSLGKDRIIAFVDLDNDAVSDLYYAMDCFVLSSKWESFGRTAVEAMSRKSVVIGTNVDGLAEVIGDKRFLYNDENQAFQIIQDNYNDLEMLNKNKIHFYNRYHELYSTSSNIKSHIEVYEEVITEFFSEGMKSDD